MPSGTAVGLGLLARSVLLAAAICSCCALILPYLVARLVLPRPPNVASARYHVLLLRHIVSQPAPPPGLSALARVSLASNLLTRWALVPFFGLSWFLDELLYGRALREVRIVAPLFEISAARSGSTQLARYLEEDPHIIAPNVFQIAFPYRWMWWLAPRTLGHVLSQDRVRELAHRTFNEGFVQRHEIDPFRTDTFEVIFGSTHLHDISFRLAPGQLIDVFALAHTTPLTEELWREDFLRYLDGVARKVMLHAPPGPDGRPWRLMIKGHFLCVATQLAERYPDARFLTVLRDPARRLQSVVNYHRVQPVDALAGPVPWDWLVRACVNNETAYNDVERDWFQSEGAARRCVVRFDDYVAELEGTMQRVYREVLDIDELPAHVPRVHAKRDRSNYTVDRSLDQLGIDRALLRARSADWQRWHDSLG